MLCKPQGLVRPEGLGKFNNLPHRVSNQRPSGLWHSALTTTLPCANVLVQMANKMEFQKETPQW
jgi:hypothetical protein